IQGGYRPYVVPDRCKVLISMRLVTHTDTAAAKAVMDEAVRAAETEVPGVKGSYVVTGDRPYVEKDDASPLLAALRRACAEVTGREAQVGSFNGYTDTAVIAGTLGNRNCMSYGPGSLELAHKPNEYVPFEDVRRCELVLARLAEDVAFGE
ncbi:MAG: M20/M25/M40 family metallo-hydrolase, partial [Clostridium sp.]|nr:M20/M25/M40 family metallo-hydrolase [Clostridium sp.]